jgi:hypothetical protein
VGVCVTIIPCQRGLTEPDAANLAIASQFHVERQWRGVGEPERPSYTMPPFDLNKSLQELDGQHWPAPTFDSHLVQECHRLHQVPLRDFTIENLCTVIGQDIGLEYLVPLAIEKLRDHPLAEGDCYPE